MSLSPEELQQAMNYGVCRVCRAPRRPQTVVTHSIVCPNGHPQDHTQLEDPGPLTSDDIEMLLAGLEVESIAELKRLVDIHRYTFENEDDITAARLRQLTVGRPDLGPGWRETSSEELFYSAAWLDGPEPVFYEASRGAARRQPHGCEGQLQQ